MLLPHPHLSLTIFDHGCYCVADGIDVISWFIPSPPIICHFLFQLATVSSKREVHVGILFNWLRKLAHPSCVGCLVLLLLRSLTVRVSKARKQVMFGSVLFFAFNILYLIKWRRQPPSFWFSPSETAKRVTVHELHNARGRLHSGETKHKNDIFATHPAIRQQNACLFTRKQFTAPLAVILGDLYS